MKNFCNTDLDEQETIIHIDYFHKHVNAYTSKKSIYERLCRKIGNPQETYYTKNKITNLNLTRLRMKTKRVVVLPYDANWKSDYEKIKNELESTIGNLIIGIEHIGSTSVEGLSAKPCIDIDVVIKDYSVFEDIVSKLAMVGYIHEGNLGIKDREAFRYSNKPHLQLHHLYVCPQRSEELLRHITFRDFLRSNPEAVKRYSIAKEKAAQLFPDDIDKYIEYKSPCIEELYEKCGLK